MFDNVIKILYFEIEKMNSLKLDTSNLQKAITVLRDGTGYIKPIGEQGEVKVIRFDEL